MKTQPRKKSDSTLQPHAVNGRVPVKIVINFPKRATASSLLQRNLCNLNQPPQNLGTGKLSSASNIQLIRDTAARAVDSSHPVNGNAIRQPAAHRSAIAKPQAAEPGTKPTSRRSTGQSSEVVARTINLDQPGFLSLRQVLEVLPISRSGLYAGIKKGIYPHSLSLGGGRRVGWKNQDIKRLLEDLANKGEDTTSDSEGLTKNLLAKCDG